MPLPIRITPSDDDTRRGCQQLAAATLPPSRAAWIVGGIYFLAGLGAAIVTPETTVGTAALAMGALTAAILGSQADARRRERAALAADPHTGEPYVVEVSEDGVRTYCDHVDTRIAWAGVTRVVETAEFYLIVRGSTGGAVVPRRLLPPDDDRRLRELVRERSPEAGGSLRPDRHGAASAPAA